MGDIDERATWWTIPPRRCYSGNGKRQMDASVLAAAISFGGGKFGPNPDFDRGKADVDQDVAS